MPLDASSEEEEDTARFVQQDAEQEIEDIVEQDQDEEDDGEGEEEEGDAVSE